MEAVLPMDSPLRNCDLVMKGGITSGVVYPHAVARLSRDYRFRSIGGTSAGAIAAALAAAAEHGRDSGGFGRLEQAAAGISGRLLELFHPDLATRPIFRALLALQAKGPGPGGFLSAAGHLVAGYPAAALLGLLPGLATLGWMLLKGPTPLGAIATLLLLLVGLATALALRLRSAIRHELPAQGFGLCSGLRARNSPADAAPALTDWLTDTIDEVAGHGTGQAGPPPPLTFGDLHGPDADDPAVELSIMTTCVSVRRPYRLPFDTREFLFCVNEWERLFPPRVMAWLLAHSKEFEADPRFRYLPRPQQLPVVVAVRMSLSFPLLISAVPLWARDFNLLDRDRAERPQRLWFSDGGISSNFPIHFFDSVWPQWPTFGITLEPHSPGHHGKERVYLPGDAGAGQRLDFREIRGLASFFHAILGSMQEWQDNLQTTLPGYRERVVHVRLDRDEGGLNLDMDQAKVEELFALGREAGETLADEFDFDAHRWRRFLVSMARLEATLASLEHTHAHAPPGGRSFADFLADYPEQAQQYEQTRRWLEAARADVADLMGTARAWAQRESLRDGRIPKPDTELRITPKS